MKSEQTPQSHLRRPVEDPLLSSLLDACSCALKQNGLTPRSAVSIAITVVLAAQCVVSVCDLSRSSKRRKPPPTASVRYRNDLDLLAEVRADEARALALQRPYSKLAERYVTVQQIEDAERRRLWAIEAKAIMRELNQDLLPQRKEELVPIGYCYKQPSQTLQQGNKVIHYISE